MWDSVKELQFLGKTRKILSPCFSLSSPSIGSSKKKAHIIYLEEVVNIHKEVEKLKKKKKKERRPIHYAIKPLCCGQLGFNPMGKLLKPTDFRR